MIAAGYVSRDDEVADCLEIGGHFDLRPGGVVGYGVVTRRSFV
jgi:hypothetical protein